MSEVVPHMGDGVIREAGLKELRILLEDQYPTVSVIRVPPKGLCGSRVLFPGVCAYVDIFHRFYVC
jgi:hypothetical protein